MRRAAVLLALASACARAPEGPPPPVPAASAAELPSTRGARMIVQPFAVARDTLDPWIGARFVPSPDGAQLAAFGPELRLVDTASGLVRARLEDAHGAPICAADAAFSPDGATLAVLACARDPGERTLQGPPFPEAEVLLWNLAADQVRRFAAGPFANLGFTDDGRALALGVEGGTRILTLPDGAPGPAARPLDGKPRARVSADGRRVAWMAGADVVLEDADTGAELGRRGLGADCAPLSWSARGDRIAVACAVSPLRSVTVLDARGAPLCAVGAADLPSGLHVGEAHLARDGEHLLLTLVAEFSTGYVLYRVAGCARERLVLPGKLSRHPWWSSDLVGIDAPGAIGWYNGPLTLIPRDARAPLRTLTERVITPFTRGASDVLRSDHGWDERLHEDLVRLLDPRAATIRIVPPSEEEALTARGAVLHAVTAGGRALPLHGSAVPGIVASLALVTPAGTRTLFARSEAYGGRVDDANWRFSRFSASRTGAFVAAGTMDKDSIRFAFWETRTGRRVAEVGARSLLFSSDETRAAFLDLAGGGALVVDTANGARVFERVLSGEHLNNPYVAAFCGPGAVLAASGLGVVDAATGKLLWPHLGDLAEQPCSARGDRVMTLGSGHSALGFGPLQIREARTGALLGSLDAQLEGWSDDGALFLVRVPGSFHEVRDAATLAVRARVGPARSAALSGDGRFVFHQGTDALRVHRVADGAAIFVVPPDHPGQRGLVYTATGLFDGGAEALRWVTFRLDRDVRKGRLASLDEVRAEGRRPGLSADFFAGKAIEPAR
jgi:hypothetical protein